jgi:predicted permease
MEMTALIFTAILPIFFAIALGFFARRIGWLEKSADQSLMALMLNVLYPALIFSLILENPALRQAENLLLPPILGFITVAAGIGLALLLARRFQLGNSRERRTFALTTGMYNYGYLPIPIIAALFGRETGGVLIVYNLGVEIAMWVLGVGFILSAHDSKPLWRRVLSGPVIAILIAVPVNACGLSSFLPKFCFGTFDMLGACAIPIALILIGVTFADLFKGLRLREHPGFLACGLALRIFILPIAFLLLALALPASLELKRVLIVQAAMPCAIFPIVLARHFGGAPEIALKLALATTCISLLTIPIWIGLGLSWIIG